MKRRRWDLRTRSRRCVLAPAGERFPIRGLLADAAVLRRDRGGAVAFTVSRLIASPESSSGAVRRALMSSPPIPPRVLPPPAPAPRRHACPQVASAAEYRRQANNCHAAE